MLGLAVLGEKLDSIISELFSYSNDSMKIFRDKNQCRIRRLQ